MRTGKGNTAAVAEVIARADRHAQDVLPIIDDIRSTGISGMRGIAGKLNARQDENSLKFVCADMTDANELTIHIFASLGKART